MLCNSLYCVFIGATGLQVWTVEEHAMMAATPFHNYIQPVEASFCLQTRQAILVCLLRKLDAGAEPGRVIYPRLVHSKSCGATVTCR